MILAWTSLGERLDIDEYWRRSVCYNLVNGLRVQKQENARTFLRDSTINWGRCHGGTPPESYIKQIRRGWLRQLWPNILVRMCRETDLSANPSRAPLYFSLCIDFWAPQRMISAGMSHEWICTISVFGWCSYCTNGSGRVVDGRDGDDCKPYWSRVEIPTWFLFFFC
jgi:hypothetical protein